MIDRVLLSAIAVATTWMTAPCGAWNGPGGPKVLFIGIDGLRAGAIEAAKTPNLDGLIENGCMTEAALAGPETVSGPGWTSLLTGVWMEKHGVRDNSFDGARLGDYPHFFKLLKQIQPDSFTFSAVSWKPLDEYVVASAGGAGCDIRFFHDYEDNGDERVVKFTVQTLTDYHPDASFVYIADLDVVGHEKGFHPATEAYQRKLETIDAQIGTILAALRARPSYPTENWLVIVATDHGGTIDGSHGRDIEEHRRIPLLISGPSALRGELHATANQVDVVATALTHLGVPIDPEWDLDGRQIGLDQVVSMRRNLLFNGGGDYATGAADPSGELTIPGWEDIGSMTAVPFNTPGMLAATSAGSVTRGRNYFSGGSASESAIQQTIDLVKRADDIDNNEIRFVMVGYFGGKGDERDLAWLEASFLDERGGELLHVTLGPVTLEDRRTELAARGKPLSGLLRRQMNGLVPANTRRVRLTLHAEGSGELNDGYADDLVFMLRPASSRRR